MHLFHGLVRFLAAALTAATALLSVPAEAQSETIIAIAGPTTGAQSERTREIEAGARRAAAKLKAEASIDFAVETFDDGCDDAKARGVARALVQRGVHLVLGHPCTSAALAAAEIYGKSRTIFISTATRHPALTEKRAGPSIFRLAGQDGTQGKAAAMHLVRGGLGRKFAIVHDRTLYAKAIADQAADVLKVQKASFVTATVVGGDKEYDRLVAKIKDADAVFYAGFPLEAGFILKSLRHSGSKADFLVSDAVATEEFARSFADVAGEVTAMLPQATPAHDAETAEAAVEVYAGALERAGRSRRMMPVSEAIESGQETRFGLIRFDASGNANVPDYVPSKWNGAQWAPAETSPSAAPR